MAPVPEALLGDVLLLPTVPPPPEPPLPPEPLTVVVVADVGPDDSLPHPANPSNTADIKEKRLTHALLGFLFERLTLNHLNSTP
jgi:hypothetical protein